MQERSLGYYEKQSIEAIQKAVERTKGKSLDEVRTEIHRSYPFGPKCEGKAYKVWNRLVLAKEAELGLAPRKHQFKVPNPLEEQCKRILEDIITKSADVHPQELAYRLRKACPFKDRTSRAFKVWSRILSETKENLGLGGGL